MAKGDRYRLFIESLDSSIPVAVRLRQWLKVGLRAFRLRAIRLEEDVNPSIDCPCVRANKSVSPCYNCWHFNQGDSCVNCGQPGSGAFGKDQQDRQKPGSHSRIAQDTSGEATEG